MIDEYNFKPILDNFFADPDTVCIQDLVGDLTKHMDKFCTLYMTTHDGIRDDTFREMCYFLQKAIMDDMTGKEDLKTSIKRLIEECPTEEE